MWCVLYPSEHRTLHPWTVIEDGGGLVSPPNEVPAGAHVELEALTDLIV